MDRRDFIMSLGTGLAAATVPAAASGGPVRYVGRPHLANARAPRGRVKMKLGCQSGPSTDEHFAFLARYGVTNVCAEAKTSGGRTWSTVDELRELKDMAERHKLSLDILDPVLLKSTNVDREAHPAIMLADSPERDRDIDDFNHLIRNCAAAGIPCIKYNMSILGVLRSGRVAGRGDSVFSEWDASKAPAKPLTRAGEVGDDAFWERITYFLERVVPVANEYKVRIACHPQDPGTPPEGYQGVHRVLGTVEGLKRLVSIHESPYHGLNFCQGTISEDLERPASQIFDVIRWFGLRRKIFNVHFRNIVGHRGHFREAFPDEGDVDMYRALMTYQEVGYDGMLMPDHVPVVPGKPGAFAESFAFAYGYIRGMLQAADAQLSGARIA